MRPQAEEAYDTHAEAMGLAVVLERLLLDTVALLTDAAVDHRVLKGSAVAHLVYPDPAQRPFGDVDLLVPVARFDVALSTLIRAGHTRPRPQLRPGFDRRFAKSVTSSARTACRWTCTVRSMAVASGFCWPPTTCSDRRSPSSWPAVTWQR